MTTLRIAVVRIPHEALAERHPVEPTAGWGRFEGEDGVAREVRAVGDALLVRFEESEADEYAEQSGERAVEEDPQQG